MDNLGECRRVFKLVSPPPVVFHPRPTSGSEATPLFEPYEENLPLQSGYYSFVIDDEGRLRVKAGNTRSHASMAGGRNAGAAGSFKMSREGKLAELYGRSTDYRFNFSGPDDRVVRYIVEYFRTHPAFEISSSSFCKFNRTFFDSFCTDFDGNLLTSEQVHQRRRLLDLEGITSRWVSDFRPEAIEAWDDYRPVPPPRLYHPHKDQLTASLQEDADYEIGNPRLPYSPQEDRCTGGKFNFVIDSHGWLIMGPSGHHLLSGCQPVGAAGQIVMDDMGLAREINLNFSGHYRPPLSADYARYTYNALLSHPLIDLDPSCVISGRAFDEENCLSTVLRFNQSDLTDESDELMLAIEAALF